MIEKTESLIGVVISGLQLLPPEAIRQVMDFVEFLRTRYVAPSSTNGVEAMLACWGTWHFALNERKELDAYLQATRKMDMTITRHERHRATEMR